jgi:drug/metabolite transporter (DMT)-like permease
LVVRSVDDIGHDTVAHKALGPLLSIAAAAMFGFGASVGKVALTSGIQPVRLTALRCTGSAIVLFVYILARRPSLLRIRANDLPVLIVLGLTGAALVQYLFFTAIDRLPVGIALLLEFTAPFLIAAYSRLVLRHPSNRRSAIAIGLGLGGLALVAKVWTDTGLDPIGVAAGFGASACMAAFLIIGKSALDKHHPLTVSLWMFTIAAVFWAIAAPWWQFNPETLTRRATLLGAFSAISLPVWTSVLWVILFGTLVPYALELISLQYLTPTVKGVTGMSEPLIAAAVAWAWLGQSLDGIQLIGVAVTIVGIAAIQTTTSAPSSVATLHDRDRRRSDRRRLGNRKRSAYTEELHS